MIRPLLLVFFLFISLASMAQDPTHWINPSQQYFRIPVARDGIYRLSFEDLQQSGVSIDGQNPDRFQLHHRGKQQSILVNDGGDGVFGAGDYLEFYGRRNDGTLDAHLYEDGVVQPNPFIHLFHDTTAYFLTVGISQGKRMISGRAFDNAATVRTSHLDEKLLVFNENYSYGLSDRDEVYSSRFESGEGWMSSPIRQGQSRDFVITGINRAVTSESEPFVEVMLVGRNPNPHNVALSIGASSRLLTGQNLGSFESRLVREQLRWTDIDPSGVFTLRVTIPNNGYNDQVSVAYVRVVYPQETDMALASEKYFRFAPQSGITNTIVRNVVSGTRFFDISDPDNVKLLQPTAVAGQLGFSMETQDEVRICATSVLLVPGKISAVRFNAISAIDYDYIILSHPRLRRSGGGYADPVMAYADYRASAQGGLFKPLVINIQDVYDHFNYGEKSPLAVHRFIEFMTAGGGKKYFFIIGKGLEYYGGFHRNASAGTWAHQDLIPPGGAPASDAIYSMGLRGPVRDGIPTGRLSAMNPNQVAAYLNKIKEMESVSYGELWRKRILHLSGGIESWEPEAFKNYLKDFGAIAEGPYFGGEVHAIAKQSREVQTVNISKQVNEGLSLVTFFGHSSTSTLDFDVGNVTDRMLGYNNKGKYPVLLMNGCDIGAFFLRSTLFGEDWVLAENLGASAFIAHNAYARITNLHRYTQTFYNVSFADSLFINEGIGDIKHETGRRYFELAPPTLANRAQVEQMILLGDPAVKLFGATSPDLEIRNSDLAVVGFDNEPVTVASDSFALRLVVRNYGRTDNRRFRVEVKRTYSDNTFTMYDSLVKLPLKSDTIFLTIKNNRNTLAGNNHFSVMLDADEIIDELNESNNRASIDFLIPGNGTKNLYPVDFSIVQKRDVRLSFQATDLLSEQRTFLLEIDTINTFDSPYQQRYTLHGQVLLMQQLSLLSKDSLAYYWRTRLADPGVNESREWEHSSFTFVANSAPGWAQVHFPQYLSNPAVGLAKEEALRRIDFVKSETDVSVKTFGSLAGKPRDSVSVKIAGQEYNLYAQGFGCRMNTVNLIAFDRSSTVPYVGVYLKWYEIFQLHGGRRLLCGREPFVINSFMHDEVATGRHDLIAYVDHVAEGDSVLLYTMGDAGFQMWPQSAREKLAEIGISLAQFNELMPGEPVVIFARKGSAPGTAKVIRSSDNDPLSSKISVTGTVTGGYTSGTMTTGLIGPAYAWDKLVYSLNEFEGTDEVRINVSGVSLDRREDLLFSGAANNLDLSSVDANEYPFIRLAFSTSDATLLTPAQLQKWIVLFTPVPEGLLIAGQNIQKAVTVDEGDKLRRELGFVNISEYAYRDSLIVRSAMNNTTGTGSVTESVHRIPAPLQGDTTWFAVEHATTNMAGMNDVSVFVNPRVVPEQYFDNNIIYLRDNVVVTRDETAPVTLVTFDGRFIENGELVARRPWITITVRDDNAFLLRQDTTGILIRLKSPCESPSCQPAYVSFKRQDISWRAVPGKREFVIDFVPTLEDGNYTLIVEAEDVMGNKIPTPYSIEFVVVSEPGVVYTSPYPNPFKDEITFGFVVSGAEVPSRCSLNIIDMSGRTVLQKDLSSSLFVGKNKFIWDGRDQHGNVLPGGVYLYQFQVITSGKQYRNHGKVIIGRR